MTEESVVMKTQFTNILAEALEDNNKKLIEALIPYFEKIEGMIQVLYENLCAPKSQPEADDEEEKASPDSQTEENGEIEGIKIKLSRKRKISKSEKVEDVNEKDTSLNASTMYCETCKNIFPRNDGSWTRHIKETGCRPYKCSRCDKRFTKRYTMHEHETEVHSTDVFNCEFPSCTSSFNTKKKLINHQTKVHGSSIHSLKSPQTDKPSNAKRARR